MRRGEKKKDKKKIAGPEGGIFEKKLLFLPVHLRPQTANNKQNKTKRGDTSLADIHRPLSKQIPSPARCVCMGVCEATKSCEKKKKKNMIMKTPTRCNNRRNRGMVPGGQPTKQSISVRSSFRPSNKTPKQSRGTLGRGGGVLYRAAIKLRSELLLPFH